MSTTQPDERLVEPKGTKLALILAAGELFAQNGLKGTSTREIATRAGSNIGCIHYHFGGKEKLYWAAVEYLFHRRITEQNIALALPDEPSEQEISNLLARLVHRRIRAACGPEVPAWHNQLLWRTVNDGMEIGRAELIDRVFRPDYERFARVVAAARPGVTHRKTRLLFYQLISQLIFYSHHQAKVLRELAIEKYDEEHLAEIGAQIAVSLTRMLDLPDPRMPAGLSSESGEANLHATS